MISNNPSEAIAAEMQRKHNAANTPQQMINLLEVQAISLNMNNAASAQQNTYTLNAAVVSSICTRILSSGKAKENQTIAS
jgi:hypothetical protein